MGHKNRRQERITVRPALASNSICGLIAYQNRGDARRAAKSMVARQSSTVARARAYHCRGGCELWHAGYLPQLVTDGVVTAGEWYGYDGHRPLKDVLIPLLERMRRRTGGSAQITRRTGPDETDLWVAMVENDLGSFVARDYDTPRDAARAVLDDYDAASREDTG